MTEKKKGKAKLREKRFGPGKRRRERGRDETIPNE